MKLEIPVKEIPGNLEISTRLTEDEMPKVYVKQVPLQLPKKEERGAAFHEKSAKNQKVNIRRSHKAEMQKKYGKPKKRPKKR